MASGCAIACQNKRENRTLEGPVHFTPIEKHSHSANIPPALYGFLDIPSTEGVEKD